MHLCTRLKPFYFKSGWIFLLFPTFSHVVFYLFCFVCFVLFSLEILIDFFNICFNFLFSAQTSRCAGHSPEQLEGAGASDEGVYDRHHRHRRRDLLSLHGPSCSHERVPRAGAQRAEWRAEESVLPV